MAKLSVENIPWNDLQKIGITKEALEKTNNLDNLLNYGKTSLMAIKGKLPGIEITGGHAKLFMRNREDGTPELRMELVRKFPNLKTAIYGTYLTDEQKKAITDGGCANIKCSTKNGDLNLLVSLDTDTNQLNYIEASKAYIPDSIAGVKLSDAQKQELKNGNKVLVQGMKNKDGESFDAHISYNAANKGLNFISNKSETTEKNTQKKSAKSSKNIKQ